MLDLEQRKLLDLVARIRACLNEAMKGNDGLLRIAQARHALMNDMFEMALGYFKSEDEWLARMKYPRLAWRRKDCNEFIERLTQFIYSGISMGVDWVGCFRYLVTWFDEHPFPALETAPPVNPAPARTPSDGRKKHILCVDDEEYMLSVMQRLLERRGYRVSGFSDPARALAVVRAGPAEFDLVVTDYNMPGLTGLEVAIAVRDIRPDLPVILTSGNLTEELRKNAPASGIRTLIDKPDIMGLCEAVTRILRGQDGAADAT